MGVASGGFVLSSMSCEVSCSALRGNL